MTSLDFKHRPSGLLYLLVTPTRNVYCAFGKGTLRLGALFASLLRTECRWHGTCIWSSTLWSRPWGYFIATRDCCWSQSHPRERGIVPLLLVPWGKEPVRQTRAASASEQIPPPHLGGVWTGTMILSVHRIEPGCQPSCWYWGLIN